MSLFLISLHPPTRAQILILGAGPAGLALATSLVEREIDVLVVDPDPDSPWPNNYGSWSDELQDLGDHIALEHEWSEAAVFLEHSTQAVTLARRYARVDNEETRRRHLRILDQGGARRITGRAASIAHRDDDSRVTLDDGQIIEARHVVDCTGIGALLHYQGPGTPGFQTAYGILARFEGDPLDGHPMVLMDYRSPTGHRSSADPVPSFLYGMHLGDDLYFVEETVLVGRPALPIDDLEARLHRRLKSLGVQPLEILEVERCHIPMGTALPLMHQQTLGFGAAAGYVHPATGYQFARTMRAAPHVASALTRALESDHNAAKNARMVWDVIWPADQRRARNLLCFGMETLLTLDALKTSQFFEHFFSLGMQDWSAYLGGEADHRRLAGIMLRLFGHAHMGLRVGLARSALGSPGELWRALVKPAPASPRGPHA